MKKVVSFSGGRTSAYLCKIMIDTFGRDNVDFIFMDTGAEHSKTYEFIREVNDEFGLNLVCLRGDFNQPLGVGVNYNIVDINDLKPDLKPFKEMMAKYGTPYIGGMFCTDRMKLTPFKKYCDDTYGKNGHEAWLGIREDEPKRLTPKKGIRYLAELSDFDKQDVLNFWSEMPFDLLVDEWSGNCLYCPKKSNLKLAASQRDNPASYLEFLEAIGRDDVRKVVTRTNEFIRTGFGFYPERFFNRSPSFIKKVLKYNSLRYKEAEKAASKKMYRGKQSLEQLIATFDGSTGAEIKARIRGGHHVDTNSCSESCEVFQ